MKSKSEVFEKFKEFHAYAVNISGKPVKIIRSDKGESIPQKNSSLT